MSGTIGRWVAVSAICAGLAPLATAQVPQGDGVGRAARQSPAARKQAARAKAEGKAARTPATAPLGVRLERDVPYATVGADRALKLDLYVPENAEGKLPLVVWVHGGGWRGGSKNGNRAAQLATRGYVTASVEYRLSDEAKFPAQIEDCKAAIRWLRAHASKYHIDPDRVGVWGSSAGGHLVALLGTAGDEARWDVGAHLDQSSRVQAVCDFCGPADLLAILPDARATDPDNAVALLLGGPVAEKREAARDASPTSYVTKDDPPFLICHGTEDRVVPMRQSEQLHEALKTAGVPSTLVKVEKAGHGFRDEGITPSVEEIQERVRAFFDDVLKK